MPGVAETNSKCKQQLFCVPTLEKLKYWLRVKDLQVYVRTDLR